MIHLSRHWPFVERAGTRAARVALERAVQQRPKVDKLAADLVRRGEVDHFAEALEQAFGGGKQQ